ncbi:MAG TPA: type VII secretion-associated serine protease mycosin [Micromonosporaceae bacterium]|nr:type VII secretion-associated serine protease mycosin [Micromonosporaceae bacterium]
MTGLAHRHWSAASRLTATALLGVTGLTVAGMTVVDLTPAPAAAAPPPAAVSFDLPRADPIRDDQWQLDALEARSAWRYASGAGVTVAVIDSGVDATHPDLEGQVLPGLDLVTVGGNGQFDPVGHGTTVAGLIAGRSDDRRGVVGLAPAARILPVRVLDEHNQYDDALVVARAVRWAVDNGARVVNLSLGGYGNSAALADALDYAFAKDVVVIACTGNVAPLAPTTVWYPAREPGVVAVAGLDHDGGYGLWANSITGPQTVLTAPAVDLVGARPGGYWRVQGTSFAAPLVTATAALIRSRWPGMSAASVVNRLINTARDLGPAGRDPVYGFGVVDPVAALTASVRETERNPLDTAPPPGISGFGPAPGLEPSPPAARTPVRGQLAGGPADRGPTAPPRSAPNQALGGLAVVGALIAAGALATARRRLPGTRPGRSEPLD